MQKGGRRFVYALWFGCLLLCVSVCGAGITLKAPHIVNITEGDTTRSDGRIVKIQWKDLQPESLVFVYQPSLGTRETPWRGKATITVSDESFYVGACDHDYNITVSSTPDRVLLSWLYVSDWNTKSQSEKTITVDSTDHDYDLSDGIKISIPSYSLFRFHPEGWQDCPIPTFDGIYRGGRLADTVVVLEFTCVSGGELGPEGNAAITLSWSAASLGEDSSIVVERSGQSVGVSKGLRVSFPAGQFQVGRSFSVDVRIPFGKAGPGDNPPADAFKIKASTFEGYLVLRRSVEDRPPTSSDPVGQYKVAVDKRRCEDPGFFADSFGKQDPGGERYFIDKGIRASGRGVTPDPSAYVLLNGFPYDYAVVTYDWSSGYELIMSPINWTEVYPTASPKGRTVDDVFVVPNPYRFRAGWEQGEAKLQFVNVPEKATIRIYDASGGYIDTVRPGFNIDNETQKGSADWNLRDSDGKQVVSGIYIYRVDAGGSSRTGRFVVVR